MTVFFGKSSVFTTVFSNILAQFVGTEQYTDCISAEGLDSPNEYSDYDTKQFDDEVSVILGLEGM